MTGVDETSDGLFSVVYSAKHVHYLLGMGNKVGESFRWNQECGKPETSTSNLLNSEDEGVPSVVVLVHLTDIRMQRENLES